MTNRSRRSRGSMVAWVMGALLLLALSAGAIWHLRQGGGSTVAGAVGIDGLPSPYSPDASDVLFRSAGHAGSLGDNGMVPYENQGDRDNRHVVHVSRRAAEQAAATNRALKIELPRTGERFDVQFERAERAPNGDWTFVGKVATRLGPQSAVLTFGPAGVFGVLPLPEGHQMQLTTTRMVTVLEPMRPMHPRNPETGALPVDYVLPSQEPAQPSMPPPAEPGHAHAPASTMGHALFTPNAVPPPMAIAGTQVDEVQIDVLAFYTTNMVELRGSVAAAETEANSYLAIANQAHRDSRTGVRLHFVGLRQMNYPPERFNNAALSDLHGNRVPGIDVAALRDELRADLVALLRPYVMGDYSGGIAYLAAAGLRGVEGADEADAYSVSNLNSYTFAHEIGHNLGSTHDVETETVNGVVDYGAFPYSFGYRQDGPPAFATIMAYPVNGQPGIGYFSHPGTSACLSVACGTLDADNARSMKAMASTISEYRLPPNMISIKAPTRVMEAEPEHDWKKYISVEVSLSTPAPVGGVHFDIGTEDGTAVAGSDYHPFSQSGVVIPEGEVRRYFSIYIISDQVVEDDESFRVVLSNVSGAKVFRGEAEVTILDDDPRVVLTGRLVAPGGNSLPFSHFNIVADERVDFHDDSLIYSVSPPNYEYRVPVKKGASVRLTVFPQGQGSYAPTAVDFGVVEESRHVDITLKRVVRLTGALRFPPGQAIPTSPINVSAMSPVPGGGAWGGSMVTAEPPDFRYSFDGVEGVHWRLQTSGAPAPFVDQQIIVGETWFDRVQDISMGTVPSLVMEGARVTEGRVGQERTIDLAVFLSTLAPSEGVQVDVEVVSGTAIAGVDFVAKAKQRIALYERGYYLTFPVVIKGDSIPEPTEWFKVVLSNPSGAWLPSREAIVYIEDDDFRTQRSDHDGDGKSDVFWRNLADGRNIIWRGANYGNQFNPGQVLTRSWSVVGSGDFDGDGKADLFWRNAADGQNIIWPSGNGSLKRSVTSITGLDWKVMAVGDFNGDGQADIFWRHAGNGQNAIWWSGSYANRTTEQAVSTAWKVMGTGDLNGDGMDDVVWRNTATGANIVWWSGKYAGYTHLTGVTNLAWEVVAVGDLNGDGQADLFWRNRNTGENIIWWNGSYANQVRETTVAAAWKVVATGDYNGDGKLDLFWRNGTTGANILWDSGRYAGRRNVTGVTNTAWVVQ